MQHDLNSKPQIFEDRLDAATKLIDVLPTVRMQEEDWLIIAISKDSIPMAELIAKKLNLRYNMLFLASLLAPNNHDCVIAKVSETEEIVINEDLVKAFGIKTEYIYGEAHRKYEEYILKLVYKYRKGELIGSLKGRNVLLLDEGCETGLTALTAMKTAISSGASSTIYATPMIATGVESQLELVADEVYTIYHITNFVDVEFYYENYKATTQEELLDIVDKSKNYLPLQKKEKEKNKNEMLDRSKQSN